MQYLVSLFFVLFSFSISAQTVINYEDGSTYTLSEEQKIYISSGNNPVFKKQTYQDKSTYFKAQKPWGTRDYVPAPEDEYEVGSHEWCKTYIPWSEGLTFDMITWQRYCDSNGDGVYDESDDSWSE